MRGSESSLQDFVWRSGGSALASGLTYDYNTFPISGDPSVWDPLFIQVQ